MKGPRFFCERCGVEVNRDTKQCPRCGRYFASIRCPACGFVGDEGLFKGGCPVCGYSADPRQGKGGRSIKTPSREVGSLPLWVYILTGSILLAVFSLLFFTLI